jgi:hypothetical protein
LGRLLQRRSTPLGLRRQDTRRGLCYASRRGEIGGVIQPRIHLSQAAILFRKTGPPHANCYGGEGTSPAVSTFYQTGSMCRDEAAEAACELVAQLEATAFLALQARKVAPYEQRKFVTFHLFRLISIQASNKKRLRPVAEPQPLTTPCLATPCLALPCLALPCLALPCLALPCLALPYRTVRSARQRLSTCGKSGEPSKGSHFAFRPHNQVLRTPAR